MKSKRTLILTASILMVVLSGICPSCRSHPNYCPTTSTSAANILQGNSHP
jgi:hypothetical protein